MSSSAPINFDWDGEAMRPASKFWSNHADQEYVIGQHYRLVEHSERSTNTHNHYFAQIADAHANLPENWANLLPTPEHLRKYALVKAGFCDTNVIALATADAAKIVVAMINQMDEFSITEVKDSIVTVYTPKSQSYRAMDKADFAKSKEDVLGVISAMIRVTPQQLLANAGMAA